MSCTDSSRPVRRGFTLIELLVVITIILLLMVVTIPTTASRSGRRVREAARAINTLFGSARAQAMQTGREVGVWIKRSDVNPLAATTLYLAEVPPPYSGEIVGAMARIYTSPSSTSLPVTPNTLNFTLYPTDPATLNYTLLHYGDMVQINNRGPLYFVTGPTNGNLNLTDPLRIVQGAASTPISLRLGYSGYAYEYPVLGQAITSVPWPVNAYSQPVTYTFYRMPVRSAAAPLELPASTVIDLQYSGMYSSISSGRTNNYNANYMNNYTNANFAPEMMTLGSTKVMETSAWPIVIMFSPDGAVRRMYLRNGISQVTEPIYLLVGEQSRVMRLNNNVADPASIPSSTADPPLDQEQPNWYSSSSVWIQVNPSTGLVRASEVYVSNPANRNYPGFNIVFNWQDPSTWWRAVQISTSFAMGTDVSGVNANVIKEGADDIMGGR